ncbi:type IV secretion system protein [Anaplasma bovis]
MPDIKPIVLLLLLTGCGYMGCISQSNVFNDVVTIVVPTNPGGEQKSGSSNVQHWRKVDFPYAGKKLKLYVEEKEPRFCEESEIGDLKIEIPYNNPLKKCGERKLEAQLKYPLIKGERVIFSLNPVREFTVTQEICRNQDEDIYVPDVNKCLKDYIGTIHLVNSSNRLAKKRGFSNEWNLIEGEEETSTIEDYVPSAILYGRAEKKLTKSEKFEKTDELCKTKYAVIKEARKEVEQDKLRGAGHGAPTPSHVTDEKIEKAIYDKNKKIREERRKYREILDETTINTLCGKLCGFSDESSSQAGQQQSSYTSNDNKCVAFRPVTYSKGNDISTTVIPFVKLQDSDLTPEVSQRFKDAFPMNGGNASFAEVEKTIKAQDPESQLTLANIKSGKSDVNEKKIKEALPQVGSYLGLDTFYEVKKDKVEKLVMTVVNEAGGGCGAGSSGAQTATDDNKTLAGSYSINVIKDCSSHIENSLYYVFSKGYPRGEPGSNGSIKVDLATNNEIEVDAALKEGELYFGVKDNGDGYENNSGHFEIRISAPKNPPKVFSHIASWTETQIRNALYGTNNTDSVVRGMYRHISEHGSFNRMVNALLILYIMVSALYFFLGFSRASISQLAVIIAKMLIVMYVLRPDSWSFFNDHLLNLFIEGPKALIDVMTGGQGKDFEFMDMVLYRFSVTETWIQILALMFSGPIGFLSVILILWALVVLVQCLFEAVVIYLISILSIALLLCLAPYFVICVLFRRTKNIFDMWIKTLLQTGMQPVIIFSCIALLTGAINNIIYAILNFEVCDTCVLNLNLVLFTLCLLKFPLPVGVIPVTPINDTIREVYNTGHMVLLGLPGPIVNVILLIILVRVAKDFVVSSGELCSIMFGSFTNLSEVGGKAAQSLLSVVGMDQNTAHILESHRRQSELFDRGPGGGRYVRSMPGVGGVYSGGDSGGAGNVRRRQIIAPHDPPASF